MTTRKNFLVIGLGRFGASLACALADAGQDVLGVDADPAIVQRLSSRLTHVAALDAANEEALAGLGVSNFDAVIVASGSNFEASILITLLLKRLGARYVVAKATTEQQAEVLNRVGADRVVQPERDAGPRLARRLISPNVLDYLTLEPGMSVAEVRAPDFMAGKTLAELDVRRRFKITILLIKNGHRFLISPDPDDRIEAGDTLVVVGRDEDIARLRE
jgi:trk system potassium uptake protein TrkA